MKTRRTWFAAFGAGLALLLAAPALAGDESSISTPMKGAKKAKGSVSLNMAADETSAEATLRLRADRLPKRKNFVLEADGQQICTLRSDKKGRIRESFDLLAGELGPGFDPRGERLSLRRDTREYLSAQFSGEGESSKSKVREVTELAPTAAAGDGEAIARFDRDSKQRRRFEVKLEDVPLGDYALYVDGAPVGTITVAEEEDDDFEESSHDDDGVDDDHDSPSDGLGEGAIRFGDKVGDSRLPLAFEPRGKSIEVVSVATAELWFQGVMAAEIPGVTVCDESEVEIDLVGVAPATGEAELESEDHCRAEVEVEVEGLAAGDYELRIAGVPQLVFQPDAYGSAKIELSSHGDDDVDDDGDELEHEDDADHVDDDAEHDDDVADDSSEDDGEHDDDEFEARLLADPHGALVEIVALADGSVVLSGTFPQ